MPTIRILRKRDDLRMKPKVSADSPMTASSKAGKRMASVDWQTVAETLTDDWRHCPRRAVVLAEFHPPNRVVKLVVTGDSRRSRRQRSLKGECPQLNLVVRAASHWQCQSVGKVESRWHLLVVTVECHRQSSTVAKDECHSPRPLARSERCPQQRSFVLIVIPHPSHGPRELARYFAPKRRRCASGFGPAAIFAADLCWPFGWPSVWWTDWRSPFG
jgi:hypothetical protein